MGRLLYQFLSSTSIHGRDDSPATATVSVISVHSGGGTAFSKSVWTVKEYVNGGDSPHITLYYHSFNGEQGTVRLSTEAADNAHPNQMFRSFCKLD